MFTQRFAQLDQLLLQHRPFWQFQPFEQRDYPWRDTQPDLCDWLDRQPLPMLEDSTLDPQRARTLCEPFLAALSSLPSLLTLPMAGTDSKAPFWLLTSVKGRKWQQISRFASLVPAESAPLLEWCAGKGHLGRLLSWRDRRPVYSLEWQLPLCEQGQRLADKVGASQHFVCADVLTQDTRAHFAKAGTVAALHACGQLHIEMLKQAVHQQSEQICLSPCCYQLIADQQYLPLSAQASASALCLSRSDLRLAVQETVTAGSRDIRRRQTERLYRLAFDAWQRQVQRRDAYLPVPSAPNTLLQGSLLDFCQWAAGKKGLPAPSPQHVPELLESAQSRLGLIQRMEWVQHQFRRALELWLALDRCLFLQEAGYQVELLTFCERQVTPRNLFIRAQKNVGSSAET